MKKNAVFIFALILSILVWMVACSSQEKELSGAEQAAVLAYSEMVAENLFAGLVADDYAVFSRDFDTYMQKTMPAGNFAGWKRDLNDSLGKYPSRQVVQVTRSDEFYVVEYGVEFEQEERIMFGLVFHATQPHSIGGLWFDSDKLLGK